MVKIFKAIITMYGVGLAIVILSLMEQPAAMGRSAPIPDDPWFP